MEEHYEQAANVASAIEFCPHCGTPLGMREESMEEVRLEHLQARGQEGRLCALEYNGDPIADLHRVLTDSATQPDIDFYVSCGAHEEKPGKMSIDIDAGIELLRITPPHKFIFVGDAGEDIGYLSWESGQLSFNGNIEESAKVFFEFLKSYVDEYITRNNGWGG